MVPLSHMAWALSLAAKRERVAEAVRSMPTPRVVRDGEPEDGSEEVRDTGVEIACEADVEPVTTISRIFVKTVPEASNAAAGLLDLATRNPDELVAEAKVMRVRMTDRAVSTPSENAPRCRKRHIRAVGVVLVVAR